MNEHTNICGVYELPIRSMSNETGLEKEMLLSMLKNLVGKVYYIEGWVCIKNFVKHQSTTSEDTLKGISREMSNIPENIRIKMEIAFNSDVCPRGPIGGLGTPDILNSTLPNLTLLNLTLPNGGEHTKKEVVENPTKKIIGRVFEHYQNKILKNSKLTPGAESKISTRLVIWSEEELIKAITNFSRDPWWMENNASRGVAWFFHSDDRIDSFVNMKPRSKPGVNYVALDENGDRVNNYDKNVTVVSTKK